MVENTKRIIVHGDMDAFFASVEQQRGNLWGYPVIVGGDAASRSVVCAASYEARKYGVKSAMSCSLAHKLCPDGIFIKPDMALYSKVSQEVMEVFYEFTPLVEQVSVDEAFLDITGSVAHYDNSALKLVKELQKRVYEKTKLTISVGVACNKFLAKVASDCHKPNAITIVPESEEGIAQFLGPMAVGRIWGVGKVLEDKLLGANIKKVSDLQTCKECDLEQLLGARLAHHLKDLAYGRDERKLECESVEKSISNEITFSEDIGDTKVLYQKLRELIDKVCTRLRAGNFLGKTIKIKVRFSDFSVLSKQVRLSDYSNSTRVIELAAKELFLQIRFSQNVRLIGFGVSGLLSGEEYVNGYLLELDDMASKKDLQLDSAIDKIRGHYGVNKLKRGL